MPLHAGSLRDPGSLLASRTHCRQHQAMVRGHLSGQAKPSQNRTATDKVVATIPVGREPLDVEYSPDGRYICTTNSEDNTVSVADAATNKVIDTIKTGKQPTSIDFLPNGRQGYVTDAGSGTVEILNFPR